MSYQVLARKWRPQTFDELVGQPQRIKEILCSTALDLGRERYFQGSGMLDILRALESI